MKIYVVTSGSYSDYHIERVFTDLEKAKKYCSLFGGYDEAEIEEYESEENDFQEIRYLRASFDMPTYTYRFKIIKTNTLDKTEEEIRYTDYHVYTFDGSETITVQRVIHNLNYEEESLKEKYLKVCHDLYAQIKYMKSMGGTTEDIKKWLKGNEPTDET